MGVGVVYLSAYWCELTFVERVLCAVRCCVGGCGGWVVGGEDGGGGECVGWVVWMYDAFSGFI